MSFRLYADKNQLYVRDREPVTSGSINIYPVRFEFSQDWDGMDKTVSFRFHSQTVSVPLDASGECVIPWEVIDHYERNTALFVGVYGTKDGNIVLPTVWASLGEILEGVSFGQNARPPAPNLWEQKLAQKQDKITGLPGQTAGFDENGCLVAQDAGGDGAWTPGIATEQEVSEMLSEVFPSSYPS